MRKTKYLCWECKTPTIEWAYCEPCYQDKILRHEKKFTIPKGTQRSPRVSEGIRLGDQKQQTSEH